MITTIQDSRTHARLCRLTQKQFLCRNCCISQTKPEIHNSTQFDLFSSEIRFAFTRPTMVHKMTGKFRKYFDKKQISCSFFKIICTETDLI